MRTIFIVVNGYPKSGKDTFCEYAVKYMQRHGQAGMIYSSVDTVKKVAGIFGWRGTKTSKDRSMLSELKDLYTKHFDGTFKEMVAIVKDGHTGNNNQKVKIVFAIIREPEEIKKITGWCYDRQIFATTIFITSNRGETNHASHSDKNVIDYQYDMKVTNNETLEALEKKAGLFCNNMTNRASLFYDRVHEDSK